MTLKSDWLVLCERVVQDSDTKNLIIFQTIESIRALSFPVLHRGFAFAARFHWEGPPAREETTVGVRFIRWSENDPEETVIEINGSWSADTIFGKSYFNFEVLRLFRPEMLWFRLDMRVGTDGEWIRGLAVPVQVMLVQATPELLQRQAAREKLIEEIRNRNAHSTEPSAPTEAVAAKARKRSAKPAKSSKRREAGS